MAHRMIDVMAEKVQEAIATLEVLDVIRDQIEWEIVPFLAPVPGEPGAISVNWLVGLGLPAAGGDYVMPFHQLQDPHSADEIRREIRALYSEAQEAADTARLQASAPFNGGRTTPGGLALP